MQVEKLGAEATLRLPSGWTPDVKGVKAMLDQILVLVVEDEELAL